jgi:hypothetical protein
LRGSLDADGFSFHHSSGQASSDTQSQKVLQFVNGDVRKRTGQKRYIHYELACGQCESAEIALGNYRTAMVEGGVVPEAGIHEPCTHRWGSLDESLAALLPSLTILGFGRDLTKAAFAKWSDGDPGADRDNDFRAWIRSKVSRSKCCMQSDEYLIRHCSAFFASQPLVKLWHRLEWLDEHQNSMLELVSPATNPFLITRGEIVGMLLRPASNTDLGVLWAHWEFEPELCTRMKDEVLNFLVSADAQIAWKYGFLDEFPFLLLPGIADEPARLGLCKQLWSKELCCLEPLMARKLKLLFKSAEDMSANATFWASLKLWAQKTRLGNMNVERLFALIKSATNSKTTPPIIERLVANGIMTQFLSAHRSAGGVDPRCQTAEELIEDGVPLERQVAATQTRSNSGGLRIATAYRNMKLAEDKQRGVKRSREELRRESKRLALEFRTIRTPVFNQLQRSVREAAAAKASVLEQEPEARAFESNLGLASKREPVQLDKIAMAVSGDPCVGETCSFRSWGVGARKKFVEQCFVADQFEIRTTAKLKIPRCCHQLHPGLCKTSASASYELCCAIGTKLWEWCRSKEFKFVLIWVADKSSDNDLVKALVVHCAHVRKAAPREVLFALATSESLDGRPALRLQRDPKGGLMSMPAATLARTLLSSEEVSTADQTQLCVLGKVVRTTAQDGVGELGHRFVLGYDDDPSTICQSLRLEDLLAQSPSESSTPIDLEAAFKGDARALRILNHFADGFKPMQSGCFQTAMDVIAGSKHFKKLDAHNIYDDDSASDIDDDSGGDVDLDMDLAMAVMRKVSGKTKGEPVPPVQGVWEAEGVPPSPPAPPVQVDSGVEAVIESGQVADIFGDAAPSGDHAAPPAAPAARPPREQRSVKWGPFTYAPVYRDGLQCGWGTVCKLHTNVGEIAVGQTVILISYGPGGVDRMRC